MAPNLGFKVIVYLQVEYLIDGVRLLNSTHTIVDHQGLYQKHAKIGSRC